MNALRNTILEIQEARSIYRIAKYDLNRMNKAITITDTVHHVSGILVQVTAVVKGNFSLDQDMAIHNTHIIGVLGKPVLDGWLQLHPCSSTQYKLMTLEQFVACPDWEDSMQSISCVEVPKKVAE